jgi:F-type H+-transporting ATPase subunit b
MNPSRKHLLLLLLVLPLLVFMTEEEGSHESDPMAFVGKVVNFVVLFGGLGFLLYKPLTKFLTNRGQEIDRSIRETREARQSAEARLQETLTRLDELTGELAEIQKGAESQGQKEKEAVIATSRVEAERLRELSRQEIRLVSQNVKRELREYAANLATEGARRRLLAKMTSKIHTELIDKSITRLGHLHEESGTG